MNDLEVISKLNHYIRVYDNVLSEPLLKKFLKICDNHENFQEGSIVGNTPEGIVDKEIRNTLIWNLINNESENSKTNIHWCNLWITFFKKYIQKYQEDTQIECDAEINTIQILKYNKGGHYRFHVDHGKSIPRTLSFIFLVNDDYEGGELTFSIPNRSATSVIDKKSNRMIIWPSNFLYPHGVKPVIKGTRYSVVAWAL